LNSPAAKVDLPLRPFMKRPYEMPHEDILLKTDIGRQIMHERLIEPKGFPLLSIQERKELDFFCGGGIKATNDVSNYLLQECAISTLKDSSISQCVLKELIYLYETTIYYLKISFNEIPSFLSRIPKNIFKEICKDFAIYQKYQEQYYKELPISHPDVVIFNWFNDKIHTLNVEQLGSFLYTHVAFEFLIAGLILLVGMFGTISLTLGQRRAIKRQEISAQVTRDHDVKMKS